MASFAAGSLPEVNGHCGGSLPPRACALFWGRRRCGSDAQMCPPRVIRLGHGWPSLRDAFASGDGTAWRPFPTQDSWPPTTESSARCRSCWRIDCGQQYAPQRHRTLTPLTPRRSACTPGGMEVKALLNRLDKVYVSGNRITPNTLMAVGCRAPQTRFHAGSRVASGSHRVLPLVA